MSKTYIKVHKGRDSLNRPKWWFTIRSRGNHKTLATSEVYRSFDAVANGVMLVRRGAGMVVWS